MSIGAGEMPQWSRVNDDPAKDQCLVLMSYMVAYHL